MGPKSDRWAETCVGGDFAGRYTILVVNFVFARDGSRSGRRP
jgi:hypothetical protein